MRRLIRVALSFSEIRMWYSAKMDHKEAYRLMPSAFNKKKVV